MDIKKASGRHLFGTDGIRGIANKYPMTPDMAIRIGKATASLFKQKAHTSGIIVGKDTRISGDMLEHAIVSGICSMGADAFLAGILPTPGIAFLAQSMEFDAGIMISASHNPFQDNGIKIFSGDGYKLPDENEMEIERLLFSEGLDALSATTEVGRVSSIEDAKGRYVLFIKDTFTKGASLEGMKVVLDCANGATYQVAPETFSALGAEVITLFNKPDGMNINLTCGSQHPETLMKTVVEEKADAGFAFDGDGDRTIAVDEKGRVITGDQILAICAQSMKKEGRLRNNLVVTTVMSNIGLTLSLKELGIEHLITRVGDRYVMEMMKEKGASIGGEDSGHIIFLDHHTSGDAIITALNLLAIMKKEQKSLSKLARIITIYPQMLINVNVRKMPEIEEVPEIIEAIKEAESELGTQGRVLVRYSGTQHMCRVMVEGPTLEETEKYCRRIADVIMETLS